MSISISSKGNGFDLRSLTGMASKLQDNDKLRGKSNIFGTKTLYQKVKSEGTHKVDQRESKREMAVSLIKEGLSNTIKQLNLPLRNQTRLEKAFENILSRHTLGKEVTGADLKGIVSQATSRVETEIRSLNTTSSYNEATARRNGIPFGGTPISHKDIKEVSQSLCRWKERPFTLTASNGNDHRTLFTPVPIEQRKDFDDKAMVRSVLTGLNELAGNQHPDLHQKVEELSSFSPSYEGSKAIDPFIKNDIKENNRVVSSSYQRKENNANLDVLMLKYTSKSLSSWCMGPIVTQLDSLGVTVAKGHMVVDQVDSAHIDIKPDGKFDVTSKLSLDIIGQGSDKRPIGSLDVTVTSHVRSDGEANLEVNVSGLAFNEGVDLELQAKIFQALSRKLPGGL